MHSPPAFVMRARAASVKRNAQTVNFGTSYTRLSSVTDATTHAILPSLPFMFLINFERDKGGLFRPDMLRRLRITLLNFESVRLARNLYSLINRRMYGLSVLALRTLVFARPPALTSMPIALMGGRVCTSTRSRFSEPNLSLSQ